jgi:hypothetical protein
MTPCGINQVNKTLETTEVSDATAHYGLFVLWRHKRDGRNGKNVTFLAFT